jgi:hypothetical protein
MMAGSCESCGGSTRVPRRRCNHCNKLVCVSRCWSKKLGCCNACSIDHFAVDVLSKKPKFKSLSDSDFLDRIKSFAFLYFLKVEDLRSKRKDNYGKNGFLWVLIADDDRDFSHVSAELTMLGFKHKKNYGFYK